MLLNELSAPKGAVKRRKRVGRGESSGFGKTSGRGNKGQKQRAGGFHKVGFEGGQMPLQRRLPKRGFHSLSRDVYAIINVGMLSQLESNSKVDAAVLKEKGLIKKIGSGLKVLGDGELSKPLIITAAAFTQSAKDKIEKAGGQALIVKF